MKIYIAKVKSTSHNQSVVDLWVSNGWYARNIKQAKIFTSIQEIYNKCPRGWTFTYYEIELNGILKFGVDVRK